MPRVAPLNQEKPSNCLWVNKNCKAGGRLPRSKLLRLPATTSNFDSGPVTIVRANRLVSPSRADLDAARIESHVYSQKIDE